MLFFHRKKYFSVTALALPVLRIFIKEIRQEGENYYQRFRERCCNPILPRLLKILSIPFDNIIDYHLNISSGKKIDALSISCIVNSVINDIDMYCNRYENGLKILYLVSVYIENITKGIDIHPEDIMSVVSLRIICKKKKEK